MSNVIPFGRPVAASAAQPAPAKPSRPAAVRVAVDGRAVFLQRLTSAGVISSVPYPSRAEARTAAVGIARREGAPTLPEHFAPPDPHRPRPGGHAA